MKPILPGSAIGVLGSGQLGACSPSPRAVWAIAFIPFRPIEDTPTGQVADLEINAPYEDLDAIAKFAAGVSVVTFEFENVPAATAAAAERCAPVRPAGHILHTTQHRLREKTFLSNAGLPLTPFRRVASLEDLSKAAAEIGLPAILKTADFGYDGKGQHRVTAPPISPPLGRPLRRANRCLEAFVDFDREISVVAARSANGAFHPLRRD